MATELLREAAFKLGEELLGALGLSNPFWFVDVEQLLHSVARDVQAREIEAFGFGDQADRCVHAK